MIRLAVVMCLSLPIWCQAVQLPITARSAIAYDEDTQQILYGKNVDVVRPMASITKLMTALVTLEADLPPDESITIQNEDANAASLRGKQLGGNLPVGITLSRSDVLHLALMSSQNRAAAALARTYPGGYAAFVRAMNAKASELGMTHTHYVDPTGLSSSNTSTTEDIAKLTGAAAAHQTIREYSTSSSYTVTYKSQDLAFRTTNVLVKLPEWNVVLQKTGFTEPAGRCMTITSLINQHRVTIVVLNAFGSAERLRDVITIRHWVGTGEVLQQRVNKPKKVQRRHKR